jgi:hypothetical protein
MAGLGGTYTRKLAWFKKKTSKKGAKRLGEVKRKQKNKVLPKIS